MIMLLGKNIIRELFPFQGPHNAFACPSKGLQIIPAFKADNDLSASQFHQFPGHISIALGSDIDAAQRVVPGGVEPGRNEDEIGVELLADGVEDPFEEVDILAAARRAAFGVPGDVQIEAEALVLSQLVEIAGFPGVEVAWV